MSLAWCELNVEGPMHRMIILFLLSFQYGWADEKVSTQIWPDPSPQQVEGSEYGVALELVEQKNWSEAQVVLKRFLEKDPFHFEANLLLPQVMFRLRRRQEAIDFLLNSEKRFEDKKKLKLVQLRQNLSRLFFDNESFQAYQNMVDLLKEKKVEKACEGFQELLSTEPGLLDIYFRLGQCSVVLGNVSDALKWLEQAKKIYPEFPETRLWLGRAYYLARRYNKALDELEKANQGIPQSEFVPLWYSDVYVAMQKKEEAILLLERDLAKHSLHLRSLLQWLYLKFPAFQKVDTADLVQMKTKTEKGLSLVEKYEKKRVLFHGEFGWVTIRKTFLKEEFVRILNKINLQLEDRRSR